MNIDCLKNVHCIMARQAARSTGYIRSPVPFQLPKNTTNKTTTLSSSSDLPQMQNQIDNRAGRRVNNQCVVEPCEAVVFRHRYMAIPVSSHALMPLN